MLSASAQRAAGAHHDVAELAGLAGDPAHRLAAHEGDRSDAGADDDHERVLGDGHRAAYRLTGRGDVVVDPHRHAQPGTHRSGHVEVGDVEVDRAQADTLGGVDDAGHDDARADHVGPTRTERFEQLARRFLDDIEDGRSGPAGQPGLGQHGVVVVERRGLDRRAAHVEGEHDRAC